MSGKSRRWTCQKSYSTWDGRRISSNTGNPQGKLWRTNSIHIPHISRLQKERARARDRWMDSTRTRRKWTTLYSRNLPSSSCLHGNDERNSDFYKGTERRESGISTRRGMKCGLLRKVQARVLHVHWSRFRKDLETLKSIQMTQNETGMNWQSKLRICILYSSKQSGKDADISERENRSEVVKTCILLSVKHVQWWWLTSVQPAASFLFSEFVIILERLMRSTLKVEEIQRQLFLLQDSRRPPVRLELLWLTTLQIMLGLQRSTSQHEHQLLRAIGLLTVRERQRRASSEFRINKQQKRLSKKQK